MPGTAQRAARPRAGTRDATALKAAELEAAIRQRDEETAIAQAAAKAEDERFNAQAVDYSGVDTPLEEVKPAADPDAELPAQVEFRCKMDLPEMTYGRKILVPAGTELVRDPDTGLVIRQHTPAILGDVSKFNFKEGRKYRVPREMFEHLDRIGAVWHLCIGGDMYATM